MRRLCGTAWTFVDEEISEKTGLDVHTPWDVRRRYPSHPQRRGDPGLAGKPRSLLRDSERRRNKWTLSSELAGYDGVNYGLWYDDAQFARVALKHLEVARKLGVKKIVIGECGHAHKALGVIADRIAMGDLDIPRESSMTLLREIVLSGKLSLDPGRNNFPITLHDPCNMTRLMGVVEPQREILRAIAPAFREMEPHGVDNYCCGGGSGFAIMSPNNFSDWRTQVSGRKKLEQVMNAFSGSLDPSIQKYVCAPCSNCKGQLRDLFSYWDIWDKHRILYGGLVELIVNAMTTVKPGFIEWDWR